MYAAIPQDKVDHQVGIEESTELALLQTHDRKGKGASSPNASEPNYVSMNSLDGPLAKVGSLDGVLGAVPGSHRRPKRRFQGAKCSLWLFVLLLSSTLALNTGILIYATQLPRELGLSIAHTGKCSDVEKLNRYSHLGINILGSLMLAASTFAMQCINSPSRNDIDRAHSIGKYLDVGILSFHNARYLGSGLLWLLLACTSLPLHLLYNSAIFMTSDATAFDGMVVGPSFIQAGSDDLQQIEELVRTNVSLYYSFNWPIRAARIQNISAVECANRYDINYGPGYEPGSAIVVVKENPPNSAFGIWWALHDLTWKSHFHGSGPYGTFNFSCQGLGSQFDNPHCFERANMDVIIQSTLYYNDDSILYEYDYSQSQDLTVDYCLSQESSSFCSIQLVVPFLAAIVGCNIVKLLGVMLAIRYSHDALFAVGDALASYLERPETTIACQSAARETARQLETALRTPKEWQKTHRYRALGWKQAIATVLVWLAVFGLFAFFLYETQSYYASTGKLTDFWQLQLHGTPLSAFLLANLPQLLISIQQMIVNRSFTIMQSASEVNTFATHRQPLRVTAPSRSVHGSQKSTYWLSLPLKYSIPLIASSTLAHWFVSMAAAVSARKEYNLVFITSYSLVNFLTWPIVGILILEFLLVCITWFYSFRQLPSPMPFIGRSSMAISAACHPPAGDVDISLKEVQWGDASEPGSAVGHCTFTSKPVRALEPNRPYI